MTLETTSAVIKAFLHLLTMFLFQLKFFRHIYLISFILNVMQWNAIDYAAVYLVQTFPGGNGAGHEKKVRKFFI